MQSGKPNVNDTPESCLSPAPNEPSPSVAAPCHSRSGSPTPRVALDGRTSPRYYPNNSRSLGVLGKPKKMEKENLTESVINDQTLSFDEFL